MANCWVEKTPRSLPCRAHLTGRIKRVDKLKAGLSRKVRRKSPPEKMRAQSHVQRIRKSDMVVVPAPFDELSEEKRERMHVVKNFAS
ncbi:unnamed protein product [Victoria cruziana]